MTCLFVRFIYTCFLFSLVNSETYSPGRLRNIFKRQLCIKGNINTIYSKTDTVVRNSGAEVILNITSIGNIEESEKPVLSRLNELVAYNQIDYYFKLENEEGPAHNKHFTVTLHLGKEKYLGQGKSHKKAKQDAALKALEKTEYESPPVKKKTTPDDIEKLTPTVLLNNLATKLGVGVTYYLLDKDKEEILHSNIILTEKNKDYVKKLNDSIYSDKNLRMKKDIDTTKGPFRLKVKFGNHIFHTTSHSIQSGRHELASKVLEYLVKNRNNINDIPCLKEGAEVECRQNKEQLKSSISKVYEEAQKRKLDVEFELIKESGLSHKKTFTTECRFGNFITVGEGSSKKESKRIAAVSMLEKIAEMEPLPLEVEMKNYDTKDKKGKNKNKKNKLIKTKVDEIEMILNQVGKSVLGMAKNIFGEEDQIADSSDDSESKNQKPPKQKRDNKPKVDNSRSSQDELLELSNILNFKVAYTDFSEKDQHISLLSLYTNPEYTCFGESKTEFEAKNVAADNALNLLARMGIYDFLSLERDNSIERDTKEGVRIVLNQVISEKKEEL